MPTNPNSHHLPFGDDKNAPWYGKDILSVKQFSHADLEYVFGVAHEMRGMVERVGTFDLLKGKILANLFYEPSTRTSSSFTAAMERLGGSVIPINEVKYSSVSKGESLPGDGRGGDCSEGGAQAGHQRGRRRGRTPHPGAAGYVYDF
jgi:aspartate carbamoyltransferase catalytic subunit